MPVQGYQVRFLWQIGAQDAAETYYWNSTTDDPVGTVYPMALALMKSRTACMGYGVAAKNFRISKVGSFRAYLQSQAKDVVNLPVGPPVLNVVTSVPSLPPGVPSTVDGSAAEANETVIASYYSGIQQHGRKFMAGCPSVMIRTSPLGPFIVGVPSWLQLFNSYANTLTGQSKWTFKARVPTSNGANWAANLIQGAAPPYRQDPANDGTFDVLLVSPPATLTTKGNGIQIRGCKMSSKAYVNPNGSYIIGTTATGPVNNSVWVQILGSQAWAAPQVLIWGTAQYIDYANYSFTQIYPTGQGTHKRGNRSLASPGKLRRVQRVSS